MKLSQYIWLVAGCVCLWACTPGKTPEPTPEPETDKYPELVSACNMWRTGGGSAATGGNGAATVYRVTSLEDNEPYNPKDGTLRFAINKAGARIIVFDVAGTIHLCAPLTIAHGDVTILGQSAPGQGICIADYPLVLEKTNNVIVRFVRVRLGNSSLEKDNEKDYDAISVNDCKNVLIDHCSASWSVDECVSCYGNENFTLQYCFITESLRNAGHVKGAHGYGGIWGGQNASFHHNLLAHHDSRNPRFDHDYVDKKHAGPIDFVNNVIYNWGGNSTYGGEGSSNGAGGRHINMVNNYYQPGPSTDNKVRTRIVDPWTSCDNCISACGGNVLPPVIFLSGNVMKDADEVTRDNWKGSTKAKSVAGTDTRWKEGLTLLPAEQEAASAYQTVLAKAGCSLSRDAVDLRIVQEVQHGTGKLIDKPSDVGGWPELKPGHSVVTDEDEDHIPDEWEKKYGLDPTNRKDAKAQTLVAGLSNYEVYLNDLVKDLY